MCTASMAVMNPGKPSPRNTRSLSSISPLVSNPTPDSPVFYQVRFASECKDAAIALVVYLAARAASVGPHVLPVAVHDAYAIPPPILLERALVGSFSAYICIYIPINHGMRFQCSMVWIIYIYTHLQAHVVQHAAYLHHVFDL
jgi:hypothetical protein